MKLLLDTHIWLWSHLEPQRLAPRVARALIDPSNELWLSPVSVWEAGIFQQKGRVRLDSSMEAWHSAATLRVPVLEAPLNSEVALASLRLAVPIQDPADRFLAATAEVYGLTLVTADVQLARTPGIDVLLNKGS